MWGSGSHNNTEVAFLDWRGLGALPWKSWENGVFGLFFAKTKITDRFSPDKIGNEGL